MNHKIALPYKYELCEICRQVHVPVTAPLVNGKRLCSGCAPIEYGSLNQKSAYSREYTKAQNAHLRYINARNLQHAQGAV